MNKKIVYSFFLSAFCILCAVYAFIFAHDFLMYKKAGYLQPVHRPTTLLRRYFTRSAPVPSATQPRITTLQGWMTFRYLNDIFHLPQSFLKDTFSIDDTAYPNITLQIGAKEKKLSLSNFLTAVKQGIDQYQKQKSVSH